MSDVNVSLLIRRNDILEQDRNAWKARALAAESNSLITSGRDVYPTRDALEKGWKNTLRYRWPGRVVAEFNKGKDPVVQFVVWNLDRLQYDLKTWRPGYLSSTPEV